jgi:hypothetical protein
VPANAPIVLSPGVAAPPPKAPAREERPAEPAAEHRWFGYATLAADLAIVGTTAVMLRSFEESAHLGIFIGASALYLGAGPLIHAGFGSGRAVDSLVLRAAALGIGTLGGALLISGFAGCTESTPCKLEFVDFAAMGAGIGSMVGAVVDGGWYAWKVTPKTTAHMRPMFHSLQDGAALGLAVAY